MVSEEVRKLAEDSARGKAIANLVSSIRQAIETVAASEAGAQKWNRKRVGPGGFGGACRNRRRAVETERLVLETAKLNDCQSSQRKRTGCDEKVVGLAEQNASSAVTMMSSANEVGGS